MISPEIQAFFIESGKNVWYHKDDGGYSNGSASIISMEGKMMKATRNILFTALSAATVVAATQSCIAQSVCVPRKYIGESEQPMRWPARDTPVPHYFNFLDMAYTLTGLTWREALERKPMPLCTQAKLTCSSKDRVTTLILLRAPSEQLERLVQASCGLDATQSSAAVAHMVHGMGEHDNQPKLYYLLRDVLVGCSRRVLYRGLPRRPAWKVTLRISGSIPLMESWVTTGDYLPQTYLPHSCDPATADRILSQLTEVETTITSAQADDAPPLRHAVAARRKILEGAIVPSVRPTIATDSPEPASDTDTHAQPRPAIGREEAQRHDTKVSQLSPAEGEQRWPPENQPRDAAGVARSSRSLRNDFLYLCNILLSLNRQMVERGLRGGDDFFAAHGITKRESLEELYQHLLRDGSVDESIQRVEHAIYIAKRVLEREPAAGLRVVCLDWWPNRVGALSS
jgi:hypothetical protein